MFCRLGNAGLGRVASVICGVAGQISRWRQRKAAPWPSLTTLSAAARRRRFSDPRARPVLAILTRLRAGHPPWARAIDEWLQRGKTSQVASRGAPLERVQLILPRSAQTRSKPFRELMFRYSVYSKSSSLALSIFASVTSAFCSCSRGGAAKAKRMALGAWPGLTANALEGVSAMPRRAAAATKVWDRQCSGNVNHRWYERLSA